jgi:hypothetical protein
MQALAWDGRRNWNSLWTPPMRPLARSLRLVGALLRSPPRATRPRSIGWAPQSFDIFSSGPLSAKVIFLLSHYGKLFRVGALKKGIGEKFHLN